MTNGASGLGAVGGSSAHMDAHMEAHMDAHMETHMRVWWSAAKQRAEGGGGTGKQAGRLGAGAIIHEF